MLLPSRTVCVTRNWPDWVSGLKERSLRAPFFFACCLKDLGGFIPEQAHIRPHSSVETDQMCAGLLASAV